MENLENAGAAIEVPVKKKRATDKAATVGTVVTSYEVRSKGYQETFTSLDGANKQADILRKRAIQNKEGVNIKIFANKQDDEKAHVVRNIKIDESFYND